MARADLLLSLVRASAQGEQVLFRKTLEALIAEERSKQHHILADRLASYLQYNGSMDIKSTAKSLSLNQEEIKGLYYEVTPKLQLSDLVLSKDVETTCRKFFEEHYRADLLRSYNLEPRHRILLAGPPGNGKTSLAEAIASELTIPFLVVRYEAIIASYLGETAIRLSRLFEHVRMHRCVLFFDEFDVVGKERGDVHETGEIKRIVSSLLLQVDSLPSYVIVVTATNHPELLDRAVWRRFQIRLELPSPTFSQIKEWAHRFEARFGMKLGVSPITLAKKLKGASFSELEDFSQNIQRQFVLQQPNGNLPQIIKEQMIQWEGRFQLATSGS